MALRNNIIFTAIISIFAGVYIPLILFGIISPILEGEMPSFEPGYFGAGLFIALFSTPGLILALPAFFLFRRKRWNKWWQSGLAGIAIGLIIVALVGGILVIDKDVSDYAGWFTEGLDFAILACPIGFFAALTFWFIEVRGNPSYSSHQQ